MTFPFTTSPVEIYRPRTFRELLKKTKILLLRYLRYIWQPLVPFEEYPPEPKGQFSSEQREISDEQLHVCKQLFDLCEKRHETLERKAQGMFFVLSIIVPALGSFFPYLIQYQQSSILLYKLSSWLLIATIAFLILGFVSVARSLAIRARKQPYLEAIIANDGVFLEYKRTKYAQSLLNCVSTNTSVNDHIAQFVRGAQALIVSAVCLFSIVVVIQISSLVFEPVGNPEDVSSIQIVTN